MENPQSDCSICTFPLQPDINQTDDTLIADEDWLLAELKCASTQPIRHLFHLVCLREWAKISTTCPLDRIEFKTYDILDGRSPGFACIQSISVKRKSQRVHSGLSDELDAEVIDSIICQVCQSGQLEDRLLMCDGCDDAYHSHCLEPPMSTLPPESEPWLCGTCVEIHQFTGTTTNNNGHSTIGSRSTRSRRRAGTSTRISSSNSPLQQPATLAERRSQRRSDILRRLRRKLMQDIALSTHTSSFANKASSDYLGTKRRSLPQLLGVNAAGQCDKQMPRLARLGPSTNNDLSIPAILMDCYRHDKITNHKADQAERSCSEANKRARGDTGETGDEEDKQQIGEEFLWRQFQQARQLGDDSQIDRVKSSSIKRPSTRKKQPDGKSRHPRTC